jgi:hypothetical protein
MYETQEQLNAEKARLIKAHNNHHLTWKELMEAIDCLEFDAFQQIKAA